MRVDDHKRICLGIKGRPGGFAIGPLRRFPTAKEFAIGIEGLDASGFVDHKKLIVWADGQGAWFLETAIGKPPLTDHQIDAACGWLFGGIDVRRDAATEAYRTDCAYRDAMQELPPWQDRIGSGDLRTRIEFHGFYDTRTARKSHSSQRRQGSLRESVRRISSFLSH